MKVEQIVHHDAAELADDTLTDLPVVEHHAEETKAGVGRTRLIIGDDQGVFGS